MVYTVQVRLDHQDKSDLKDHMEFLVETVVMVSLGLLEGMANLASLEETDEMDKLDHLATKEGQAQLTGHKDLEGCLE